jgi:hypothetical protein
VRRPGSRAGQRAFAAAEHPVLLVRTQLGGRSSPTASW